MQVSIGSFRFLLNRQNEYVDTAIGLGRRYCATPSPANVWVLDENELRPKALAAATERPRKVLRLIDVIIFLSKYYFSCNTAGIRQYQMSLIFQVRQTTGRLLIAEAALISAAICVNFGSA